MSRRRNRKGELDIALVLCVYIVAVVCMVIFCGDSEDLKIERVKLEREQVALERERIAAGRTAVTTR